MKQHIPTIAGGLLGLAFIVFGLNYFLQFAPMPPMEEGSPPALFMGVLAGSGFLALIKVLEILGGVLVAIPSKRAAGLLILGPIVVNILAFHVFITGGAGLLELPVIAVTVLSAYLLWVERARFGRLVGCPCCKD